MTGVFSGGRYFDYLAGHYYFPVLYVFVQRKYLFHGHAELSGYFPEGVPG